MCTRGSRCRYIHLPDNSLDSAIKHTHTEPEQPEPMTIEPVTVKPIEPMQIKAIKPRVFANTATALFVINGIWRTYNSDNDLPAIKQSDHIFWQGKLWSNGRLLADPEELGDESLLYDLYHYFDGLADESICARELLDTPDCFL